MADDLTSCWLQHAAIAIFDCERCFPLEGGRGFDDLNNWFVARGLVAANLMEPCTVSVAVRPGPVPQGVEWGTLVVESGRVWIGSTADLPNDSPLPDDFSGEGYEIALTPGTYKVGLSFANRTSAEVFFEATESTGKGRRGEISAPLPPPAEPPTDTRPLVEQLGLTSERLAAWVRYAGTAAKMSQAHDRKHPLWVSEGMVQLLGKRRMKSTTRPAAVVTTTQETEWFLPLDLKEYSFHAEAGLGEALFVWDVAPTPSRCLRVTFREGAVAEAVFLTAAPVSQQDREECKKLVQAGFDEGQPTELSPWSSALRAEMDWSPELLTVRLGPAPASLPITIRVSFETPSGQVLPGALADPLWHKDGKWEFQLWLLGERAGSRNATIAIVGS